MSYRQLTKQEALELITPIVDGEVDETTRTAFFRYIEQDVNVRKQYESLKRVKHLMSSRCPTAKAPEQLKHRIREALSAERASQSVDSSDEPVYDIQCQKTPYAYTTEAHPDLQLNVSRIPGTRGSRQPWIYVSTVGIFIALLFWSLVYVTDSPSTPSYSSIEEYAYQYYSSNNGSFIQPAVSTTSLTGTEAETVNSYNLSITVPPLTDAEFKGVVYTDVIPNYKAPLLQYYIPQEDQYIYIFAFDTESLNQYGQLNPDQGIAGSCASPEDFHIRTINNKQVVSWKWNDTWYAAISNHDGEKLASLVQPLKDRIAHNISAE